MTPEPVPSASTNPPEAVVMAPKKRPAIRKNGDPMWTMKEEFIHKFTGAVQDNDS